MKEKIRTLKRQIVPSNKFNFFIISLIVVGIVCGSIYYNLLSQNEIKVVKDILGNFFDSVKGNSINYGNVLVNSFISEFVIILIVFILGFSMIGIPVTIFLVFMKGLTLGFTLSSLISMFSYKGVIFSFIYIFPAHLFSIFNLLLISFYSINFSLLLIKTVFKKRPINMGREFKKYGVVLLINFVVTILYSLSESYLFPNVLKWVIQLLG